MTKTSSNGQILLEVKNLKKYFPVRRGVLQRTVGHVKAVEDVSFAIGLGIGYRINELGMIELEYTQDSGSADVGTLGLNALLTF